jgi:uncharacterized protein (TIGR02996 family)
MRSFLASQPPICPQVLAFLRDGKQHPDDDTPRLVLADWLEEHGDPRGEFVRLQVQRAALAADDLRQVELRRREAQLYRQYASRWLGPLDGLAERPRFRRGFLWIEMSAGRLLDVNLAALTKTEAWAWVEGLKLNGLASLRRVLPVVLPLAAQVSALDLSRNRLGPEGARTLARSPHLTELTRLDLHWNELDDDSAEALADSPYLGRLTVLNLFLNHLTGRGAAVLAQSPHLARLIHLDLQANRLGSRGAEALAHSSQLTQLARLNLENNRIGSTGANALAHSTFLNGLTHLGLAYNPIGADFTARLRRRFGAAVLLRQPFGSAMRT